MYRTRLREIEGAVMLVLPSALIEQLDLSVGAAVNLAVEGKKLLVEPQSRPVYTMDELLALCDPNAPIEQEDREWLDAPAVGNELL